MKHFYLILSATLLICVAMTGCKGNADRPVNGTLESAVETGDAPQAVHDAMTRVTIDERYETVMEDKTTGVAVYSLLKCSDEVSSEGYGMVIAKGDVMTALPKLRHGRMPRARYDATTGDMWIAGSDVEGTGVLVERLYQVRFGEDGYAAIVSSIDPYDVQQALSKVLTYSTDGQNITFYSEGKELVTVTNHIEDMGEMMDDAIYIGEQISYSIEGPITVHVTPGLNFVTGKVLHYDDMPTLSAKVTIGQDDNIILGEITVDKE